MILLGDDVVSYHNLFLIEKIEDIKNTTTNSVVAFSYDIDLMRYCQKNEVEYAVIIADIKEIIYASALDAKYIICQKQHSVQAQKIAENYMFDSKILTIINSSDEISWVAINEIDGAIYQRLLRD